MIQEARKRWLISHTQKNEQNLYRYQELVGEHRQELQSTGVTTLPGLVLTSALDTAIKVGGEGG